MNYAAKSWYEVQEATAKVLNAIKQESHEGIPLLVSDMFLRMLIVLAFLNKTPYTTLAKFVAEVKGFRIKPPTFPQLREIMVKGTYGNLTQLEKKVISIFNEFEELFDELDLDFHEDNIDPNIPYKTDFNQMV